MQLSIPAKKIKFTNPKVKCLQHLAAKKIHCEFSLYL